MKPANYFGHYTQKLKYKPSSFWHLPACKMGLEWEFENGAELRRVVGQQASSEYLQVHDDGSLRDAGVEIVTRGDGLFGEDLLEAIYALSTCIGSCARPPTCGYRTAFHVHLDARDIEAEEIHNLLLVYCLIEIPLFNFVGRNRYDSNFCVPWGRSDAQFYQFKTFNSEMSPRQIDNIKQLQRYSALNCQSLAKYGTLEFRHMENNLGEILTKQLDFIKITQKLKAFAQELFSRKLTHESLFRYLKGLSKEELLRQAKLTELPTSGWDYTEALMLASSMVEFKLPEDIVEDFNDAPLSRFAGTHPNWK